MPRYLPHCATGPVTHYNRIWLFVGTKLAGPCRWGYPGKVVGDLRYRYRPSAEQMLILIHIGPTIFFLNLKGNSQRKFWIQKFRGAASAVCWTADSIKLRRSNLKVGFDALESQHQRCCVLVSTLLIFLTFCHFCCWFVFPSLFF